jgi:hypothetical protein
MCDLEVARQERETDFASTNNQAAAESLSSIVHTAANAVVDPRVCVCAGKMLTRKPTAHAEEMSTLKMPPGCELVPTRLLPPPVKVGAKGGEPTQQTCGLH